MSKKVFLELSVVTVLSEFDYQFVLLCMLFLKVGLSLNISEIVPFIKIVIGNVYGRLAIFFSKDC